MANDRREQFNLVLTAAERERLRELATEARRSQSAVVRELIRVAVVQSSVARTPEIEASQPM